MGLKMLQKNTESEPGNNCWMVREEMEDRIIVCNMAGQRIWWKGSEIVTSYVCTVPKLEEGLEVIPSVIENPPDAVFSQ